ncbi:hypothetical protein PIB30_026845 [Stylosanthes scabra]|uniref:Protein kinase domain-containing protein n=1 Tax=Stylosanthes scabra TaxID=79078 RepID=A0ABU6SAG9_9FABA|nr:hypothetical protein [Stylosanthes scabra]
MVFCSDQIFYPQERDALLFIRDSLNSSIDLHGNWVGPPCTEANQSKWIGITCSNFHVVHIVLEGINLSGTLNNNPTFLQNITLLKKLSFRNNLLLGMLPNLTSLVSLEEVIFSDNHFSGKIPFGYVDLPSLRVLELQENYLTGQIPPFDQPSLESFNLSYNHLVGPIPQTHVIQSFPVSSFENNTDLCGKPLDKLCPDEPSPAPSPVPAVRKNKRLKVWIIALIASSSALFLFLIIIALLLFCKRRASGEETIRRKDSKDSAGYVFGAWAKKMVSQSFSEDSERLGRLEFSNKKFPVFDLDDLLRASAEVLGRGKLGITYKASLENGALVAVKRLSCMNELSKKEFLQQMQLLGRMKHENLVEIVSFYYSEEQKLIIYEFMSDGTLFELLHDKKSRKVPHANLKSTNVLIQQDSQGSYSNSKLTDYGFFPLLTTSRKNHGDKLAISRSTEFVKGNKKLTHKTDVYCFGIIMLEIITGKIPGQVTSGAEIEVSDLSNWVRTVVNNDWSTDILDLEILAEKEGHDAMLNLTELALECTDVTPQNRPNMSQVLMRIQEIELNQKRQ